MMNENLVSIIVPCFNAEEFISKTIESVLYQNYKNWEMIIIDDFSTDSSISIIEKFSQKDFRIKLLRLEKNQGPAIARNLGIKKAQGRYIAFLDSDDYWGREKLDKHISFMNTHSIEFSFTSYYRINELSEQIIDLQEVPYKIDYTQLLKQNVIGCLTVIYDTKTIGKIYMPEILKRQDFGLWLKILKKVPYAYGLNEPLSYYRVRKSSVSSNKLLSSRYNWILYREVEKLPLHKAIYYFGWYTYKSILKYK